MVLAAGLEARRSGGSSLISLKLVPVRRAIFPDPPEDRWRITLVSSSRITPRSGLSPRRSTTSLTLFFRPSRGELANARETTRDDFL